jgi:hypothetical protein
MKPRFGSGNHDVRKPSSGAPAKALNTTTITPFVPEAQPPKAEMSMVKAAKMARRIPAAGESSLSKKDGAAPPMPNLSKSEIREFIKAHFPPGFPLPPM